MVSSIDNTRIKSDFDDATWEASLIFPKKENDKLMFATVLTAATTGKMKQVQFVACNDHDGATPLVHCIEEK